MEGLPMDAAMDLKELHDQLLENTPSGVEHDAADCPLCADHNDGASSSSEGGVMSKTYSQDELDAAVAAAVKPLEDTLQDLKAGVEQSEIEQRHAKEKAELESKISEIQAQLDSAVLKAAEAEKQHTELVAFLEAEQAKADAAAEIARRREDRLAVVKQVASFPDEYMEANADRWAALADEDFAALTEDWKAIASKPAGDESDDNSDQMPAGQTAMVASRNDESDGKSAVRDIFDLTLSGVDPRTVH
jgi:fibronectin type 3 domain-containing protein